MKYWLLAVLLANIALFLVEYRSGVFESPRMHVKNAPPEKRRADTVQNNDEADLNLHAGSPVFSATHPGADSENGQAQPKAGLSLPNNISPAASKEFSSTFGLIAISDRAGTATQASHDTELPGDRPASAIPPLPLGQAPVQTPDALPEPSKDAVDLQPVRNEAPSLSLPASIPVSPAPEKKESVEKSTESPGTHENAPKGEATEIVRPAPAAEKRGKTEKIPAHPVKSQALAAKNKHARNAALAKDSPVPRPISPGSDKVMTACYMAGPIAHAETLNTLLRQFRPQLTELAMSPPKTGKTRKHNSFVVYYPASPSMKESFLMADTLKNTHGVKDLRVVRDGEMKGAISLGVFGSERNAESAKNKFEQKGLQVRIKPSFPADSAYKVRMRWTAEQERVAEQLVDALSVNYPDTQRITSCE